MRGATRVLACAAVVAVLAGGGRWATAHPRDDDRPPWHHGLAAAY